MLRPLLVALLALLLVPAAARAASDQVMTFEAPGELLDDSRRDATLDEIQSFGVRRVRALVYWRDFAPNRRSKQVPRFDTADHAAYPAGTWDRLDRLVASIQARGMELQLTLTGPVPTWATKRKRGKVADPSAKLYGRWVRAVAARYGDRVNLWSIWNEPNHPDFLGPQYHGTAPHTPKLYRKLYVAAENAIHGTAGNGKDKVLFGETAPIGNVNVVSPLAFLRGALCLNSGYEKRKGCKKLRIDGYAHHAYTRKAGPTFVSEDPDEVSIGSLGRLTEALDKAARAGAIASRRDIYLTEFGIQSKPDPIAGVSLSRQAEYTAIAERMAYANPRVKAFSQYLMQDDKPRKGVAQGRAVLGLRDRAQDVERQEEAGVHRVHAPARRDPVRLQRRAVGPRPADARPDRGHDRAPHRRAQVEAPDRAGHVRRLRLPRRPPGQAALPRQVDPPRRRHAHRSPHQALLNAEHRPCGLVGTAPGAHNPCDVQSWLRARRRRRADDRRGRLALPRARGLRHARRR